MDLLHLLLPLRVGAEDNLRFPQHLLNWWGVHPDRLGDFEQLFMGRLLRKDDAPDHFPQVLLRDVADRVVGRLHKRGLSRRLPLCLKIAGFLGVDVLLVDEDAPESELLSDERKELEVLVEGLPAHFVDLSLGWTLHPGSF